MNGGDLVVSRDPAIKLFGTTIRTRIYSNSPQKPCQTSLPPSRDVQGKVQSISTRSCTKVHKKGTALGRSVDHTKFNNYDELIAKLDQLFEFGGESMAPKENWLIVYTDDEWWIHVLGVLGCVSVDPNDQSEGGLFFGIHFSKCLE
ncbi:hypothetical protein PVL29_002426 [Vitis rotundifolia]|uniref:PB1 domain-containing protein n=1 Tax=Vitis rotundifolia TaxID=103349 RepID=A0AA39AH43_VITRO|nr:hypothetical protein PVL29_002426 [Vitis rotundifolia]